MNLVVRLMKIIEVKEDKKQYLDLLLLADEQENMIDRYLDKGKMYVLDDNGIKCECIVTDEGSDVLEIKNCFLQALFGQSCKTFLDIIASPNWTKLQSLDWQLSCQPNSHCRPYLVVTARGMETEVPNSHLRVHVP